MIADVENPAEQVFLDGKPLDLNVVTMADDERGIVERLVIERDENGHPRIKRGPLGQPIIEELRGDVRIIMPARPPRLN